jgi:nitroreductase/NAD-dependent dihydropyrimidine dehydrogenase PreA subunit
VDFIRVNEKTCNRDGICAAVCPAGLIDFRKDAFPTPVDEAEEVCIRCGHCVASCPTDSLVHREIRTDQCPPIRQSFQLAPDQCEHFLRRRRSIRVYRTKPVPRETIHWVIEIARYAPSGHNSQCVQWLVLDTKEELHHLAGIVVDWMRHLIQNQPELAADMHLERTVKRWENGVDVVLRHAPAVVVAYAHKDNRTAAAASTLALSYLDLAANTVGLGCCWAGYFNGAANVFPAMIESLALPEGHQPFGSMMICYPKYGYHRLPARKPPPIIWR